LTETERNPGLSSFEGVRQLKGWRGVRVVLWASLRGQVTEPDSGRALRHV
jgi:hypothetical protein